MIVDASAVHNVLLAARHGDPVTPDDEPMYAALADRGLINAGGSLTDRGADLLAILSDRRMMTVASALAIKLDEHMTVEFLRDRADDIVAEYDRTFPAE